MRRPLLQNLYRLPSRISHPCARPSSRAPVYLSVCLLLCCAFGAQAAADGAGTLDGEAAANAARAASYTNVRVNTHPNSPEETSIAINPMNPQNVVGVAQVPCRYYYTFDQGMSWIEGQLPDPHDLGDPAITFDSMGNAYYCYIGTWSHSGIFVNKSTDGGVSWRPAGTAIIEHVGDTPFEDKSYPVTDWTSGPTRGNVYVCWTQFDDYGSAAPGDSTRILFSRSTNGGVSFSPPLRISNRGGDCVDSDNTVEGAVPAVGPDGTLYTAWSGPRGIEFDRSTNAGISFSADRVLTDQPGGWDFDVNGISRANGLPITKADISPGIYRGRVYVCWSDQRFGDTDVFLMHSDDRGSTWSDRVRVNTDTPGNGLDQFFPWMDVDPIFGTVYVAFYDRREHPDNLATDVYLAVSSDGGQTFVNERISDSPFTPSAGAFFGDYMGISAYGGVVRPLWMRLDGNNLSLWTALINPPPVELCEQVVVGQEVVLYPNPVRGDLFLRHCGNGKLPAHVAVFDPQGRLVRNLQWAPDQRTGRWDGRDARGRLVPTGVYFLRIEEHPARPFIVLR